MVRNHAASGTRALMERHGIKLTKSLGQNLLTDKNITKKIAALSGLVDGDIVIEVGSGLGALTVELADSVGSRGKVIAVEIDRRIIPALTEALGVPENMRTVNAGMMKTMCAAENLGVAGAGVFCNVEIVHADFLDYDLDAIPGEYKLTGNLPYYVTTPIIMKAIESEHAPSRIVFMIQKEVAKRLTASPGSKDYGAISVAVQYRCETEYAFDVSREVFMPKPNVDSAVIVLTPFVNQQDTPRDEKLFFDIVKAGFGQRRKMLRNALSKIVTDKEVLEEAFKNSGIRGTARAETLSVADFIALSDAIKEVSDEV